MLNIKMFNFCLIFLCLVIFSLPNETNANQNDDFKKWVVNFKSVAIKKGISNKTFDEIMKDARFLPKVIEYDRYQPEFYEDTFTYVKKRSNSLKVKKGLILYKNEKDLINEVEENFLVEKELLLALMGIETNFGKYLGKMDIVSSLATLSFDQRRSAFFTNELITLLKLLDQKIISKEILFGSWAGAFGNFQFMPSTIKNYAIDYDNNNNIELKQIKDSFASAANYMSKIGWKKNKPCFYKIKLKENIPVKYLNSSAKKIKNKKKYKFFKQYFQEEPKYNINENELIAIITPDKDIISNSDKYYPAYIVFNNYEQILKWNRSLRFALAVCTLKDKIKNEI